MEQRPEHLFGTVTGRYTPIGRQSHNHVSGTLKRWLGDVHGSDVGSRKLLDAIVIIVRVAGRERQRGQKEKGRIFHG